MSEPAEGFIEVDSWQRAKSGQLVSGDVFLSENVKDEGRIVSVLSDGLGSGVHASVLATMTATMALKFAACPMDRETSAETIAETIMDTLPTRGEQQDSYSTFTLVDVDGSGETRIMEHGNPSFLLVRPRGKLNVRKTEVRPKRWQDRIISYSNFKVHREDRIVFFSDGVTRAGMGDRHTPLGWSLKNIEAFVRTQIDEDSYISARELSRRLVARAAELDGFHARDDITCGVVYFRNPRQLLVLTGPPYNSARDSDLARMATATRGRKVICGGTTANIIARVLNREIKMDVGQTLDLKIPQPSRMQGFDLVTEGILTLSEVLRLLEAELIPEELKPNAAVRLARMMLDSDIVKFAVGTRINEANQDPNIPVELGLRRDIVKRIARVLETRYMKRTAIQYL